MECTGGNVKSALRIHALAVLALLSVGGFATGCKLAPDLTQDQAKAMLQAKYDKDSSTAFSIAVDDAGMQRGVDAKYWIGIRRYSNGYWGDFKLTPEGAKAVKLPNGGDVIQWRPDTPDDSNYMIVVVPIAPVKFNVQNVGNVETIVDSRTVSYTEDVDLSGLPAPLQNIAQNPGNQLHVRRIATFALANGAWTLQSMR